MDKRPEKLTDQDNLIALQMNMKQKTRLLDILTILFLMLILYGFAAAMIILPDNTFSEQENRYLQQAPKLTLERLIGGKFTSEIGDYYSDQFPIRDIFVGAKAITEIAALKMENNKVILGKDGYIIKRDDYPEMLMVERNLISVTAFSGTMKELKVPYAIAMAGRNVDVLEKYLPALFPYERTLHLWNYFEETMASDGYIQYIDLKSPLKATVESSNEQLYYKADHHWTTLGAYYGYAEIMKAFDVEPQPLSAFTIEQASDSFYGTTWSSAGMKWIKPDTIYFFRYDGDENYITDIRDKNLQMDGFYDYSYLSVKDKYSSFIGGNNARVDIYLNDGIKRERLLLIKDSFAHSVAPFLAYHYDLVIIDLRYFKTSIKDLVINENIDRVLILNNINSITEVNVFGILSLGLNK